MSSTLSILFHWLVLSDRGRRVRRWSFLVTLPGAFAAALAVGLGAGIALVAARFVLALIVVGVAWRLGGERGEAVRDLLMHPRVRRYVRVEMRVLGMPFAAMARPWRCAPGEFSYHRGDERPAVALALLPMLFAEAAVVHLLLPGSWLWAHLAVAAVHVYGLLWLFAWAAGPRLRPHRIAGGSLLVRGGVLHEARVPLDAVTAVAVRRRSVGGVAGFSIDDGAVLLPARRRVDLWLDLAQPIMVVRPLGPPVWTSRIAIAADEPGRLATVFETQPAGAVHRSKRAHALLALPELLYGSD